MSFPRRRESASHNVNAIKYIFYAYYNEDPKTSLELDWDDTNYYITAVFAHNKNHPSHKASDDFFHDCKTFEVGRTGIEPVTISLKGCCSTS
jgi:hypothetical protein